MQLFRSTNRCNRLLAVSSVLALVALTRPAWADIVEIAWDSNGRFERSVTVPPAKFTEICGKLPAGLKLRWAFDASTPLDFNIHYHVGKQVLFPSQLKAVATVQDTLDTRIEQDYCWMWSNKSALPATVTVKMQR